LIRTALFECCLSLLNMSNLDQFISASKIQERFGISSSSLRRWDRDGKIKTIRTPGGFRLYRVGDVEQIFNQGEANIEQKAKICYARVSSEHQRGDLKRQVQDLKERFSDHEIIQDVGTHNLLMTLIYSLGSGLNYKRHGFQTLLERVYEGSVSEVCITHKDRLCRYGFELVEFIFKKTDTKLMVRISIMHCGCLKLLILFSGSRSRCRGTRFYQRACR
jgi:putative resolvase